MRKLARNNFHYKQLLELNRLNRLRRELTFQLDETRRKKNIVNHLRQVVSNNDVLRRDLLIKFFDRLGLNFKSFLFILQEAKKKIGAKIIKLKGVTPNLVKEDTREEDIEVNN